MMSKQRDTIKTLLLGFVFAVLMTASSYADMHLKEWFLLTDFPFGWLKTGVVYLSTLFHELGHTFTFWFYGYPAIPAFDFTHGGGVTISFGQQYVVLLFVWTAILYGIWYFNYLRHLQIFLGFALLFNAITVFNDAHEYLFLFMGPLLPNIIASYFLYRALFNLAPRGFLERFLNAYFGLSIIFLSLQESILLVTSSFQRSQYFLQKGGHGMGDFDRMGNLFPFFGFNGSLYLFIVVSVICLLLPFAWYFYEQQYEN